MEKELQLIFNALLDWKVFVLILVYLSRPIIIKWIEKYKYDNLRNIDNKLTKIDIEIGVIKKTNQTPIKSAADIIQT
ncbi:MAG: hypothetical protein IPN73_06015 [Saprospiraceae bacterium]|nr:hypothetical protein [Saprospiraceae bacterium]